MNANLRKEARSLLPVFSMTLAVTTVASLLLDGSDAAGIVSFIFGACCALMAACSFGNEFQSRTLTLLLAQPMARSRIWRDKMMVLGAALAISYVVAIMGITFLIRGEGKAGDLQAVIFGLAGLAILALCSTPLYTLHMKNVFGGAACAGTWPLVVWGAIMGGDWLISRALSRSELFFANAFEENPYLFLVPITAVYCAVSYWLGYKVFLEFQLIDVQAQEINLPVKIETTLAPLARWFLPRYSGSTASLVRKELQLHRTTFIIVAFVCALMAIETVMFEIHAYEILASLMFLPFFLCILLVPAIAGGMCLAEEKNWGMAGWQLTQPPSVFKQWLIKMLVVVGVCVVLGIILPLGMFAVIKILFARSGMPAVEPLNEAITSPFFLIYWLNLSLILYASSISTNTLRAIIAALGLLAGMVAIIGLINVLFGLTPMKEYFREWLTAYSSYDQVVALCVSYTPIIFGAVGSLMTLLFFSMMYYNFKNSELSSRRRWIQLSVLGFCAVGMGMIVTVFGWL